MSIKFTRYDTYSTFRPTGNDQSILSKVAEESSYHVSGGNYNMLARWYKGSKVETGKNRLNRPASTLNVEYPDICGVHAELDLFFKSNLKGGTVYIAGTRKNGSKMNNTCPCIYCMTILRQAGIRSIVFYKESQASKIFCK